METGDYISHKAIEEVKVKAFLLEPEQFREKGKKNSKEDTDAIAQKNNKEDTNQEEPRKRYISIDKYILSLRI